MVARVLPQLTTDVILGMDFLRKYNPHVDWSRNTLSFVLDSRTVAVDASTVPGSIRARFVSANAWLRELRAEPDSDCFWRWCALVTVKGRGKMALIRNMLGYVTNLLMCLSSLG